MPYYEREVIQRIKTYQSYSQNSFHLSEDSLAGNGLALLVLNNCLNWLVDLNSKLLLVELLSSTSLCNGCCYVTVYLGNYICMSVFCHLLVYILFHLLLASPSSSSNFFAEMDGPAKFLFVPAETTRNVSKPKPYDSESGEDTYTSCVFRQPFPSVWLHQQRWHPQASQPSCGLGKFPSLVLASLLVCLVCVLCFTKEREYLYAGFRVKNAECSPIYEMSPNFEQF